MHTATKILGALLPVIALWSALPAQSRSATIPLVQEWRLSGTDELLLPLGRTNGMLAVNPNGMVALAQSDDHLVRIYRPDGRPVGDYGREGHGPGEFPRILGIGWQQDTLWVRTGPLGAGQSLVFVGPDLTFVRQLRLPDGMTVGSGSSSRAPGFPPVINAALPNGDLVATIVAGAGGLPAWTGAPSDARAAVVVVAANGALQRVIGVRPSGDCFVDRPGGGRFPIPFCQDPPTGLSPGGRWFVSTSCEALRGAEMACTVRQAAVAGTAEVVTEIRVTPAVIPRTLMDRESALLTGNRPELNALLRGARVPGRFAPIREVLVGDDGVALLRLGTDATRREWLLLDARGRVVGSVVVPESVRVRAVTRSHMWVTIEDPDGLEDVVQYRMGR